MQFSCAAFSSARPLFFSRCPTFSRPDAGWDRFHPFACVGRTHQRICTQVLFSRVHPLPIIQQSRWKPWRNCARARAPHGRTVHAGQPCADAPSTVPSARAVLPAGTQATVASPSRHRNQGWTATSRCPLAVAHDYGWACQTSGQRRAHRESRSGRQTVYVSRQAAPARRAVRAGMKAMSGFCLATRQLPAPRAAGPKSPTHGVNRY